MANEITEIGQLVPYRGPVLTLLGSDLGNNLKSLLVREGSGAARGWKLFDPTKADYLNTKKVLNPGDVVLVNAKALPMDFPVQTAGAGGGAISWPPFGDTGNGPTTEIAGEVNSSQAYLPSFAFTAGTGTLEMQLDGSGTWVPAAVVGVNITAQFRIVNAAPFTGILTLTPQ
ncbi:hypothetical protein [Hymenobacter sp. PAMC 26628]|uniref:hypothetical protein n=1 Tax=Hymenobacter sp. PAMC 26628 TaxID=1484118 RepID=UPI00076FFAC6|nr:hypothetical protein [Hymenobacter sp. PAMC 26628]AMJ65032.1 hypothetical protein AXW84_06025 [Hymenobacter sp. PAMC 26628]